MKKIISLFLLIVFFQSNIACFAGEDLDRVQIALSQVPLRSKLKGQYSGYKCVIMNNSNQKLNLINAQISNATNGSVAYQNVSDGHPIGITWAIAAPVGLFTFGIGWAVGAIATPFVWIVSETKNNRAKKESIAYPNVINLGYIDKGDSIEANFLVPIGTKPQMRLTVQTDGSKDLQIINSL